MRGLHLREERDREIGLEEHLDQHWAWLSEFVGRVLAGMVQWNPNAVEVDDLPWFP